MTAERTLENSVRDNREPRRFELDVGGQVAFASYLRQGSTLIIPHVEAPPPLRGTGAAGRLMQGVMELARAEKLKVVPYRSYAAHLRSVGTRSTTTCSHKEANGVSAESAVAEWLHALLYPSLCA
jgi:hypothetical protein